jgi:ribonuclease R
MSRHKQPREAKIRLPEVTRESVLDFLGKSSQPASARDIAHALGLRHHGRRELQKILLRSKRKGEIEEAHPGRFRLAGQSRKAEKTAATSVRPASAKESGENLPPKTARDPNLIEGRLVAHRDGYGFVVPAQAVPWMDGDLFIGRDQMGDAMHGDRVLARIDRRGRDGRAEGRIVRVLNRAHPTVVGLFRYGPRGNVVLPYDTRLHHEIVIPPGEELTPELREKTGDAAGQRKRLPELEGAVVNVELTRFPKGGVAPAGRVVEILGRPGEIGVDIEIIIRKHHLPNIFPVEVLEEARATPQHVSEADWRGRRDFRDSPIVTIDGETAKDFDDAVHVKWLANGNYELQVHIADVASYVRRESPQDREARLRGTSVYFPGRAVPMLREELSNGICSLKPHVDRLVMSALMEIDGTGDVVRADFMPGVIRSAERMTYTNVNKVLEGDAEMLERYAALAGEFRLMRELALLLNARRAKRGSIDFDLPERVIEFDEMGRMVSIGRSDRNIAHRIIEEFMLAANEAVASYLEHRGIASLHRVHEKPDPKKVMEFEGLAHAFGYSLGVEDLVERRVAVRHGKVKAPARGPHRGHGRMRPMEVKLPAADEIEILPQHYQRLTQKIAGKPEERIVSYLMLRSLKQARYAVDPLGHFALATDEYTHFTSPIRRYPDLIVHRALKWALENPGAVAPHISFKREKEERAPAALGPYHRGDLESIATESSEAERRADLAERELVDWKTAQYMEQHLGDEYEALIISVQKFGFFVELIEIFVEGLVPIDHLEEAAGERCFYREQDQAIVTARGRRSFHLGDRVRVRADRIDPFRLRVEFSLVSAAS